MEQPIWASSDLLPSSVQTARYAVDMTASFMLNMFPREKLRAIVEASAKLPYSDTGGRRNYVSVRRKDREERNIFDPGRRLSNTDNGVRGRGQAMSRLHATISRGAD